MAWTVTPGDSHLEGSKEKNWYGPHALAGINIFEEGVGRDVPDKSINRKSSCGIRAATIATTRAEHKRVSDDEPVGHKRKTGVRKTVCVDFG